LDYVKRHDRRREQNQEKNNHELGPDGDHLAGNARQAIDSEKRTRCREENDR
jgi:hypothetical protein